MAKPKSAAYQCQSCGASYAKWVGRCLQCQSLNQVSEISPGSSASGSKAKVKRLSEIPRQAEVNRSLTEIDFLDRVLSGGLPKGAVVLLAGEPGIGKSTLLFQMLAKQSQKTLYVSAEESLEQVASRFHHFQPSSHENLNLVSEGSVESILEIWSDLQPECVVIDSIQMMTVESLDRSRGTMATLRDAADALVEKCKQTGSILWLIGHVNKDGDVAGPKTLEHLVDTVLTFQLAEDGRHRILQSVKHRFGRSGEVAILEMSSRGLSEAKEDQTFFRHQRTQSVAGCALASVHLGSRFVAVEIQALVVETYFPSPRRNASGFDLNRLHLLLAVLEKRLKLGFSRCDVYLNVVGGLKISDPAADLAVVAALVSALNDHPIALNRLYVGELGLTGEIRSPASFEARSKAHAEQGFLEWVGPAAEKLKAFKQVNAHRLEAALDDLLV